MWVKNFFEHQCKGLIAELIPPNQGSVELRENIEELLLHIIAFINFDYEKKNGRFKKQKKGLEKFENCATLVSEHTYRRLEALLENGNDPALITYLLPRNYQASLKINGGLYLPQNIVEKLSTGELTVQEITAGMNVIKNLKEIDGEIKQLILKAIPKTQIQSVFGANPNPVITERNLKAFLDKETLITEDVLLKLYKPPENGEVLKSQRIKSIVDKLRDLSGPNDDMTNCDQELEILEKILKTVKTTNDIKLLKKLWEKIKGLNQKELSEKYEQSICDAYANGQSNRKGLNPKRKKKCNINGGSRKKTNRRKTISKSKRRNVKKK